MQSYKSNLSREITAMHIKEYLSEAHHLIRILHQFGFIVDWVIETFELKLATPIMCYPMRHIGPYINPFVFKW